MREAAIQRKIEKQKKFKLQSIEDDDSVSNAFSRFSPQAKVEDVFTDVKIDEKRPKRETHSSKAKSSSDSTNSFFSSMFDIGEQEKKEDKAVNSFLNSFDWGFGGW